MSTGWPESVVRQAPDASKAPDSFERAKRALGLSDSAQEGDTVSLTPAGLPRLEGVIDYLRPHFLGLRTSDALYCFFGRNAFGSTVGMSAHLFGANADGEAETQRWQNWLNAAFA